MEFIDLQTVTDALRTDDRPNYVIDRVTIYGQIGKEMPRPMNIANNVRTEKGGKFAEFKLFGVNLSTHARILEDVFKITSNDYFFVFDIYIFYCFHLITLYYYKSFLLELLSLNFKDSINF